MPTYQHSHSDLETLWELAGGPPWAADTAAAIAQAESGGCQYAKAGPTDDRPIKVCTFRRTTLENSYGLWQINRQAHPTYTAADLYTPLGNARAAVAISSNGTNFEPWTTYTNGAFNAYLTSGGVPQPQPGTGQGSNPSVKPATALGGYADLRNVLGHHLPLSVFISRKYNAATLRLLGRRSRVKGGR